MTLYIEWVLDLGPTRYTSLPRPSLCQCRAPPLSILPLTLHIYTVALTLGPQTRKSQSIPFHLIVDRFTLHSICLRNLAYLTPSITHLPVFSEKDANSNFSLSVNSFSIFLSLCPCQLDLRSPRRPAQKRDYRNCFPTFVPLPKRWVSRASSKAVLLPLSLAVPLTLWI